MDDLTITEVVQEMRSGSPLAKARSVLEIAMATIEQGMAQRKPLTVCEVRNIEFEAVRKIAANFGVDVPRMMADPQPTATPTDAPSISAD
jgi:hypothetical protein